MEKMDKVKIGIALYDLDWNYGSGTQRFMQEVAYALLSFKQSLAEYKAIVAADILPAEVGLNKEVCINVPYPDRSFFARVKRKTYRIGYGLIDKLRNGIGLKPLLRYRGKLWIREWLSSLDLDLLFFPAPWYEELVERIPLAVNIFDLVAFCRPEFWHEEKLQRKVVFNWYARHASLITCSFDFVAKDMMKYLNVPAERIATVFMAPPKIDASKIADINLIKEKHPLPERFFIYPAATWPHKNHLNLIKAISRCIAKGTEVYCVCTGEHAQWLSFDHYDQIQAEIKKHHLEKYIYFTGCLPYPEVLALEKQADFFCIPTLYEAGCYPVWEACFFGKAVAASDVTMIPYQIQDTGILFNPYDVDDIAKAITLLWKDKDLRDYLGQKAKSLINNPYYSHERMAQGYHRAFVNTLVRLGRLSKEYWIEEDPAPVLDKKSWVPKFAWRKLV